MEVGEGKNEWIVIVAGQISQSLNMTCTRNIHGVVVVTADTNVGILTLITKVIVSQSHCLLALTYFVM